MTSWIFVNIGWNIACCQTTITWTNVDLSPVGSCFIHLKNAIVLEMLMKDLKIACLKSKPQLPGDQEINA